jgi:hypoxanthine phosphoribosyltransferase
MPNPQAVIFDFSTLVVPGAAVTKGLEQLLDTLKGLGIKIVVFSTKPREINEELGQANLPPADLVLSARDVGESKGSPVWIQRTAEQLGILPHQMLYVGDDKRDWTTALGAGTFYLHAGWRRELPQVVPAFVAPKPESVWRFVSNFLVTPSRFEYSLDVPAEGLSLRCLLNTTTELPATTRPNFALDDLFQRHDPIMIRSSSVVDLLMLHALSSLYVEGLIVPGSLFCVYPGSDPGRPNERMNDYLTLASKVFLDCPPDLLVRGVRAHDSSEERKGGRTQNATFANQTNSVHLNASYADAIRGRTVVVFDDFSMSGKSLEWARQLLNAAGVARVVLFTLGKVAKLFSNHEIQTTRTPRAITPFTARRYDPKLFETRIASMKHHEDRRRLLLDLLERWRRGLPYEPSQPQSGES